MKYFFLIWILIQVFASKLFIIFDSWRIYVSIFEIIFLFLIWCIFLLVCVFPRTWMKCNFQARCWIKIYFCQIHIKLVLDQKNINLFKKSNIILLDLFNNTDGFITFYKLLSGWPVKNFPCTNHLNEFNQIISKLINTLLKQHWTTCQKLTSTTHSI